MTTSPVNLNRLQIATPCPISWEQMTGDSRVRFCDHCQLNVYNISELSPSEAESLIALTEGRLCARLFRRADGTVLTKDCPVGLRALRMRVTKRTAAIFATIVSLSGAAFGQELSGKDQTSRTPQTKITRTNVPDQTGTSVTGTVVDVMGSVIPNAKILITDVLTNETTNAATNDEGKFALNLLADRVYSIKIESPGFKPYNASEVVLERNTSIKMEIVLEVAALMGDVVMVDRSAPTKH